MQTITWTQQPPTADQINKQVLIRYSTTSYEFDDVYTHPRTDVTYAVGSVTRYGDTVAIVLPVQQWTDDNITVFTTPMICFDIKGGMDKTPQTVDFGTIEGKRYLTTEYPLSFGEPNVVIHYAII